MWPLVTIQAMDISIALGCSRTTGLRESPMVLDNSPHLDVTMVLVGIVDHPSA